MLKIILILLIVSGDDTIRKSFCVKEVRCVVPLLKGVVITRKL